MSFILFFLLPMGCPIVAGRMIPMLHAVDIGLNIQIPPPNENACNIEGDLVSLGMSEHLSGVYFLVGRRCM